VGGSISAVLYPGNPPQPELHCSELKSTELLWEFTTHNLTNELGPLELGDVDPGGPGCLFKDAQCLPSVDPEFLAVSFKDAQCLSVSVSQEFLAVSLRMLNVSRQLTLSSWLSL
jgi:hypothetical protein